MNLTKEQLEAKMEEYRSTLSTSADERWDSEQEQAAQFFTGFLNWLTAPPPLTFPTQPLEISSVDPQAVLDHGFMFARGTTENNARLIVAAVNAYAFKKG